MKNKQQYQERVQKVKRYIQEHLEDELCLTELSDIACFSAFHFQRLFSALQGEPLYAYIRRLRLQHAADELVYSNNRIIDIAMKAGYATQAAFNKAFKQASGLTPVEFRENKRQKMAFSKQQYRLIYGDVNIKPEMITLDAQAIIYVREFSYQTSSREKAFSKLCDIALKHHLLDENSRFFSMGHDNPDITAEENLRYDACMMTSYQGDLEGVERGQLNGGCLQYLLSRAVVTLKRLISIFFQNGFYQLILICVMNLALLNI